MTWGDIGKSVMVCFIVVGFGYALFGPKPPSDLPQEGFPFARVIENTVFLRVTTPNGSASGSGVVLSNAGLVVTAAHMLWDVNDVQVIDVNSRSYEVANFRPQKEYDLGLIRVETSLPGIDIETVTPKVGDIVYLCGHVAGEQFPWVLTHGVIAKVEENRILTDCEGFFGCSGGGLYSARGRLLGIVVGGLPGVITTVIPIKHLVIPSTWEPKI